MDTSGARTDKNSSLEVDVIKYLKSTLAEPLRLEIIWNNIYWSDIQGCYVYDDRGIRIPQQIILRHLLAITLVNLQLDEMIKNLEENT